MLRRRIQEESGMVLEGEAGKGDEELFCFPGIRKLKRLLTVGKKAVE